MTSFVYLTLTKADAKDLLHCLYVQANLAECKVTQNRIRKHTKLLELALEVKNSSSTSNTARTNNVLQGNTHAF